LVSARHDEPRVLTGEQRIDWLRLIRSENVGPVTFHGLVEHFGGAGEALRALPGLALRGGREARVCSREEAERELEAARRCGAELVAYGEAAFPPLLGHIEAPPPVIYMKGAKEIWRRPAVAIVGSRNASALGRKFARGLAAELGAEGLAIVSGLARGVDTAAHHGAVDTGTIAVLAGGIDVIYPPENAGLYDRIPGAGAIISEAPPGFQARAQDFPRRNRLISGASLGVVVVEAAQRSGSLITARFALEQNRQVFAVPGHPLDPRSAGGNGLLRQGARLVACAQDVLDELEPLLASVQSSAHAAKLSASARSLCTEDAAVGDPQSDLFDKPECELVFEALGAAPVSVDDVIRATSLSPAAVKIALLELELAGRLDRRCGQLVSRR
jgi:DNA processing protein